MPTIETRGLTKDFGGGKGIFDLDLSVGKGVVHGFLGPNGAGKTTTIRLLLDFLRPTRGDARVLGRRPWEHAAWIRRNIGYVPGELALPESLTGQRFLADSAELRGGVDPDWLDFLADHFSAQLHAPLRKLSKGNKQKVALLDALQHRPRLLIMDEPTDGLDPLLRHQVHDLLRHHVKRGGTVFLSSHIVHEIQTTCDEVSIVLGGRLRRQDRIDRMLASEPVRVEATVPDLNAARVRLMRTPGVSALTRNGHRVRFDVRGQLLDAMQALIDLRATDVIARHDLEDTFLRLYEEVGHA